MNSEIKRKLDDLNELLAQNYITDSEYAIARENVLSDAGIDIVPRMESTVGNSARDSIRPLTPRREQRGGCGCFVMLLLLLVVAAGCLFALPEDIVQKIPGVGQLLEEQRCQELRQAVTQFIDDLRGNPAPVESSAPGATGSLELSITATPLPDAEETPRSPDLSR